MIDRLREFIPYYRRNLKLAMPVMLTQLGAALVGLFDSVMVGHYSTTALAAVSFSNAIFFTVMVFAMGILMGITPLVGIEVGKMANGLHCEQRISSLLQNGMWLTLLLCLVMGVMLGGCIPFLESFGQDPSVVKEARPYYILIVLSLIPFLFFTLQKQFLEGLGNTTVAMVLTILVNGLNILLNWVLVFGHCGFPAMGATGAGIATFVSRLLLPVCFTLVILLKKEWRRYLSLFSFKQNSLTELKQLFTIGWPIGLQTFLETITFTLSFIIIGWLSKEALAAQQIANQIADLTFMLALGIGSATTIRVSIQLGKGDIYALGMAARASVHLVLLMNTIGAMLMISCRHLIPYLFTNDPAVAELASTLILFAGLLQYADGMQCVGAAMLRGITDVKRPMTHTFIAYILVAFPIGLFCTFPLRMGATGMWVGFIFGLALAAVLFHLRFHKKYKELQEKFAHLQNM